MNTKSGVQLSIELAKEMSEVFTNLAVNSSSSTREMNFEYRKDGNISVHAHCKSNPPPSL